MPATLEDLKKDVDSLKSSFDALDKPDLSRVKTDDQGRVRGEWDDDSDGLEVVTSRDRAFSPRVKSHRSIVRRRLKSLNYTPHSHFKSFGEFLQKGFSDPKNIEAGVGDHLAKSLGLKAGEIGKTIQGMSEQVGSDGGVLVLPEYSTQIFDRVYQNDIFARTDNYNVSGNGMTFMANKETSRANGSRHGGLRGYWTAEGGSTTASKPGFRELSLKLRKLAVIVYLTEELLEDAAALQQYVISKVDQEINFMVGDAVFNGVGAGMPLGVMLSPALLSIAKETSQAAATVQYENINKMWARMYAPSRASATWYINQDVEPALDTMGLAIGTGGAPVYLPQGGVSVAPYTTLKNRPIQETEFQSTLGTQGDIVLADLGQYITISKGGIAQAVSMHVEFLTGQTALRFTMRLDGQTWENSPITPFKGTNTQSSFITLDTRA